jgi:(1->4)-alpha-D-glucan 1-alpha-D-glucosylmutase
VDRAIDEALRRNPALEPTIFDFIRQLLLPVRDGTSDEEFERRLHFAMKVQQFTGPVQAKGVEDTAFYRHAPLLSINEVGADPPSAVTSLAAFHEQNLSRHRDWPLSMLATATHDTKRGEDARLRLDVLSEMPERWRAILGRWRRLNAALRRSGDGGPDAIDEYLYYQTLIAAWPDQPGNGGSPPEQDFVRRVWDFMRKAMREAKRHTSWINPSAEYEDDVRAFVESTLLGKASAAFRRSLADFAHEVAYLGMLNSLAQLVIKVGSPGVADFYQGVEFWDLSLVDPDNRRPVDFAARAASLDSLMPLIEGNVTPARRRQWMSELVRSWTDGRLKLFVTAAALRMRRSNAELFLLGDYVPLQPRGEWADCVVAFVRRHAGQAVLVAAPRLVAALCRGKRQLPVGAVWGNTTLELPRELATETWRDGLTGQLIKADASHCVVLSDALTVLPFGLLLGSAQ